MNINDRINLPEVSGGYSNSKIIRTGNGVFHTGMTLDDARLIGRDKCFLRRDFNNLDKNKDNVLTNDEIILEREREAKMLKWDAILMGAFAVWDIVATIKRPSIFNAVFAALFTGFSIDSIGRKNKMDNANEILKQQLRIQG